MTRILPPFLHLPLLLLLAACNGPAESPVGSGQAVDDRGEEIALDGTPRRVIPLAPNITELLVAAGAADRIVAISPADDYPPEIEGLPQVSTFPLDLERVLSLRPDLLFANTAINRQEDARRLADLGTETFFFDFQRIEDVPRALRTIGDLLDTAADAESAAQRFESEVEQVLEAAAVIVHRPRVLLLIGDQTLYAFGDASYTQQLIEIAGGESVTRRFTGEGVILSEEFVLQAAPDVIVGTWGEDYDPARFTELQPAFRTLPAVRNGQVHSIDPDLLVRPGPRLTEGLARLARFVHQADAEAGAPE